jgi:hypothetical protein
MRPSRLLVLSLAAIFGLGFVAAESAFARGGGGGRGGGSRGGGSRGGARGPRGGSNSQKKDQKELQAALDKLRQDDYRARDARQDRGPA